MIELLLWIPQRGDSRLCYSPGRYKEAVLVSDGPWNQPEWELSRLWRDFKLRWHNPVPMLNCLRLVKSIFVRKVRSLIRFPSDSSLIVLISIRWADRTLAVVSGVPSSIRLSFIRSLSSLGQVSLGSHWISLILFEPWINECRTEVDLFDVTEVKFREKRSIFQFILSCISNILQRSSTVKLFVSVCLSTSAMLEMLFPTSNLASLPPCSATICCNCSTSPCMDIKLCQNAIQFIRAWACAWFPETFRRAWGSLRRAGREVYGLHQPLRSCCLIGRRTWGTLTVDTHRTSCSLYAQGKMHASSAHRVPYRIPVVSASSAGRSCSIPPWGWPAT